MEIKVSYFTVVREERTRYVTNAGTNLDAYAIKVRAGDLSAFDSIDQLIRPAIRRMTFKYDLNEHDREDLIQEMMCHALYLCQKYDGNKGHYRNYVLRSCRLKMYDYINYFNSWHQIDLDPNEAWLYQNKHALSHLIVKEMQAEYVEAVNNLSHFEKQVMKLLFEGCTFNDIAVILNKGSETILSTTYRIKFKLGEIEDLHTIVDNSTSSRYSILELK